MYFLSPVKETSTGFSGWRSGQVDHEVVAVWYSRLAGQHEDRDHGVDVGIFEHGLHPHACRRSRSPRERAAAQMSTGLRMRMNGGVISWILFSVSASSSGITRPSRAREIGEADQHRAGRRQERHPVPRGQRRHRESFAGQDEVRVVRDADDARLSEHPVDQTVLGGHRRGVGSRRLLARLGRAALEHHHGLRRA